MSLKLGTCLSLCSEPWETARSVVYQSLCFSFALTFRLGYKRSHCLLKNKTKQNKTQLMSCLQPLWLSQFGHLRLTGSSVLPTTNACYPWTPAALAALAVEFTSEVCWAMPSITQAVTILCHFCLSNCQVSLPTSTTLRAAVTSPVSSPCGHLHSLQELWPTV